jgi:3-deoxy-7-phosphoheptulonate synthase
MASVIFSSDMGNSKVKISLPDNSASLEVGGGSFVMVAGPCSIDSEVAYLDSSRFIKKQGGQALRGAVFKMRSQPKSFQGLGREGYQILQRTRAELNMPIFTELVDPRHIDELHPYVDVFQVGSRNMYNYELLKELGRQSKPVLLKRGFTATLDEWSGAADYLLSGGNTNVILCERGVRGFDPNTRNILDLSSALVMKQRTGRPVIVDPSHGTGRSDLVIPMSLAAAAAGVDGLLVEVHGNPLEALSDGDQAITPAEFEELMKRLKSVLNAVTKTTS